MGNNWKSAHYYPGTVIDFKNILAQTISLQKSHALMDGKKISCSRNCPPLLHKKQNGPSPMIIKSLVLTFNLRHKSVKSLKAKWFKQLRKTSECANWYVNSTTSTIYHLPFEKVTFCFDSHVKQNESKVALFQLV